ncbi:N-formylglutamate amidohydrolase [Alphaproteobacteria bacterium]|nr:N-formylglutamate amidohydrolase [Alphaproteobacteria bacterium]
MYKKFIRAKPKNKILITVPHAGNFYPDIFINNLNIKLDKIRKIEDFESDKIINLIDKNNADMIIAQCSRVVVDLNRSRLAIDNSMFKEEFYNGLIEESKMIEYGLGVFPKTINGTLIFKKKLSITYPKFMLENYYDPFHDCLSKKIKHLTKLFGYCYHIDLHTMPSKALVNLKKEPDIVLGNNFGNSCSLKLVNYFKKMFENNGLVVEINKPYAGGFITRNYGNPSLGCHSLQIEINRKLYMNEKKNCINNLNPLQKLFANIFNNFDLLL